MGGFSEFFLGKPGQMSRQDLYSPEQQAAMNQIMGQSLSGLQNNKFDFSPIEAQARQGFQQKTIPGIAERFSMMGSGGGQRSSAFAGALGGAGAGLETDLASMRSQYGLKQQDQLMNLLQMVLRPQHENIYSPSSRGFLGGFAGSMGQGMGQGISSLLPLLFSL